MAVSRWVALVTSGNPGDGDIGEVAVYHVLVETPFSDVGDSVADGEGWVAASRRFCWLVVGTP